MSVRLWQRTLRWAVLVLIVAGLAGTFVLPPLDWQGGPRLQMVYELIGACIALEVAIFAVSRFGLERRRLPLFIGLAYLSAVIADAVAALLAHGSYFVPLVGETIGLVAVWTAGRLVLAGFLLLGLVADRKFPVTPRARGEIVPALVMGGCAAFVVVQGSMMTRLPWVLDGARVIHRPGEVVAGVLMVAALAGYWRVYRRLGGSVVASVLVSLVVAIFAEMFMARSVTVFDGFFNLALVLKTASYLPPLLGLFVESVTLFRAQKRLTAELQVAQAELRDYSKGLERKVAERTQALESRAKDLEAFAYTASHDLKAPLRGVHTYAQLLLADYAGRLDATGRRYLESVNKAALNMRQTIDDLLAYSRLDRRDAEMGRVDLRDLTEALLDERRSQIDHGGIEVKVDVTLPAVTGDRAMLREALANLIDNAIKYSGQSQPPRVTVRGREEDGRYVVSVIDNGIGFDMQYKDKIFQIFERLHRSDEFEGTGIGLSIVKRAIEKHGGRVWAESEPGKGATFYFSLPRPEAGKS